MQGIQIISTVKVLCTSPHTDNNQIHPLVAQWTTVQHPSIDGILEPYVMGDEAEHYLLAGPVKGTEPAQTHLMQGLLLPDHRPLQSNRWTTFYFRLCDVSKREVQHFGPRSSCFHLWQFILQIHVVTHFYGA